jgi:hypothetical protein
MGIPKRKTNIDVWKGTDLTKRRQGLLDMITKSDTNLPESILHDDLDKGFLDYIIKNLKVTTDGKEIPIIEKLLTIQRWGEYTNNWTFTDEDNNITLPFIAIIRKPEVQFGTHAGAQRTIPDRAQFFYASVPKWNGAQLGADIYTIPQPVPVDISYTVSIVCTKFRDLNKFNKKVMTNFASRQDYTNIKGHYIPIVLESIDDASPVSTIDGRRFYLQNYNFTLVGYLMDSEEFQVKPAISRLFTMVEFIKDNPKYGKTKVSVKDNLVQTTELFADGLQNVFNVGESIGTLFGVYINGQLQTRDLNYLHISYSSKIEFIDPYIPQEGDTVTIIYYKSKTSRLIGSTGRVFNYKREEFSYTGTEPVDGGGNPIFTLTESINSVVSVEINGLAEQENIGFTVTTDNKGIILSDLPAINSNLSIGYLY